MNDLPLADGAAKIVDVHDFFGPPLLYPGESEVEYRAFYEAVRASVRPKDTVEAFYLRDAVDYAWEARRYRRLKKELVESSRFSGLWRILTNLVPDRSERGKLLGRWVQGDAAAKEEVAQLLDCAGFEERQIEAHTVVALIEYIEVFDRQIMQASRRTEALLREIERRRESFARRLRDGLVEVEDAETVDEDPLDI